MWECIVSVFLMILYSASQTWRVSCCPAARKTSLRPTAVKCSSSSLNFFSLVSSVFISFELSANHFYATYCLQGKCVLYISPISFSELVLKVQSLTFLYVEFCFVQFSRRWQHICPNNEVVKWGSDIAGIPLLLVLDHLDLFSWFF